MMDFFGENGGFTNKHGLERERVYRTYDYVKRQEYTASANM